MFHATEFDLKKKKPQFSYEINVLKSHSYCICGICIRIPLKRINMNIFKPCLVYIQTMYVIVEVYAMENGHTWLNILAYLTIIIHSRNSDI